MNFVKKTISYLMLTVVIATTFHAPRAKAVTDPYAALASATIAVYAVIAIGGTMVAAGLVWSTAKVVSRDVAIQEAKDDALVFLANDGQGPSVLLENIFIATREKLAKSISDEELSQYTDLRLAEMLISGVNADMVITE